MLHAITTVVLAGAALLMAVILLLRLVPRAQGRQPAAPAVDMGGERDAEAEATRVREENLLVAANWYRQLFINTGDLVFVHGVDEEGQPTRFREVNELLCTKLGYSRSKLLTFTPLDIEDSPPPATIRGFTRVELVTLSDEDIVNRRRRMEARSLMKRILAEKRLTYERVFVGRTGKKLPVQIDARCLEVLDEPMIMCIARDISEQKAVERALSESLQRSRDFFDHSPIGVAIYDAKRQLTNVNGACLRMYGCPGLPEFAGFNMFDNPFVPDVAKKRLADGETARFESAVRFDEAREYGLVSSRTGEAHLDVLVTNLGVDSEFRPKGFLAQVQDITERRKAELALQESERQLRQAQKMEAIGTLAGGIAHDFNNILTPILGYTEMSLYSTDEEQTVHGYLKEVMKAGNRAKELVNQILTFSRQMEPEGRPIKLTPIVKEVLTLLRGSLPKDIDIKRSIKTGNDVILANPTQIHQIMMNLCTNAAHAMKEAGGVLEVWLTDFTLGGGAESEFAQLAPGRYVRLSVKDTGVGMDQKTVDRIFEPFFTTKESGEGTGMGLAVVHGTVTALSGDIRVETSPGNGATFHVMLPLIEQQEQEDMDTNIELPSGTECVLYVDDDEDVGGMVARMLATLGYQPVVTSEPEEALWLFKENPDQFAAVMTDHVMPRMTGAELAAKILAVRPGVPVILCTGYGESVTSEQVEAIGVRELMMKPLIMRNVAQSLRTYIDRSSANSG